MPCCCWCGRFALWYGVVVTYLLGCCRCIMWLFFHCRYTCSGTYMFSYLVVSAMLLIHITVFFGFFGREAAYTEHKIIYNKAVTRQPTSCCNLDHRFWRKIWKHGQMMQISHAEFNRPLKPSAPSVQVCFTENISAQRSGAACSWPLSSIYCYGVVKHGL